VAGGKTAREASDPPSRSRSTARPDHCDGLSVTSSPDNTIAVTAIDAAGNAVTVEERVLVAKP
jgi:hypothetical protein